MLHMIYTGSLIIGAISKTRRSIKYQYIVTGVYFRLLDNYVVVVPFYS